MVATYLRETCRLCDSRRLELAVPMPSTPIADEFVPPEQLSKPQPLYDLNLWLCLDCAHVQLRQVVDPELLFGQYLYVSTTSPGLVDHFRQYADHILTRLATPAGSLVLDIGSNDGSFLRCCKEKGMRVLGVDPARAIAEEATKSGVETVAAFFTSDLARRLRAERGTAVLITANNVFAHSDVLADMADGVRELLAPDGTFVFEVSYLKDVLDNLLIETFYHEHLGYHAVKPMALFLKAHGLRLVDVERSKSKGGTIRGYAVRAESKREAAPVVEQLIEEEAKAGLSDPKRFRDYAAGLDATRRELLALMERLRREGRKIAGFGASAGMTTLTYYFGVGGMLDFLVDDNVRKQGLYSPGLHIPVLSPAALTERKPDYVLLLAWRFREPIFKKQQAYTGQGGRWILPLPKVEIV